MCSSHMKSHHNKMITYCSIINEHLFKGHKVCEGEEHVKYIPRDFIFVLPQIVKWWKKQREQVKMSATKICEAKL